MKTILRPRNLILAAAGIIGLFIATSYVQLNREVPDARLEALTVSDEATTEAAGGGEETLFLPWPSKGSAAVAVGGAGLVASNGDTQPRPIASLAKVMTAYVILKDHPLRPGEPGPTIEVQQADVDVYLAQQRNGESVIPVKAGQTFTQQELMQGLLIPSGNNFAHLLANWSSGSVEAFVVRMNEEAAALGMSDSHYEEPSGISPLTTSTATDQARLAEAAMADPLIAQIVNMKQATLTNVGVLYNVNSELGKDSQNGIKTGWTEEAGGCFMFAGTWAVDGVPVQVFGAVLGQDTLADAFNATKGLIATTGTYLRWQPVVAKDAQVASLETKWGGGAAAIATADAALLVWPGLGIESELQAGASSESVKQGQEVGTMVYRAGNQQITVAVVAGSPISGASLSWRLTRLLP